jgi:hypothetical protein
MNKATKLATAIFAIAIGTIGISEYSSSAKANSTAAPVGHAGDPKGSGKTCNTSGCHTGNTVVVANNVITTDIPITGYAAGETYIISVDLNYPGHTKFGFQVSPQSISGTPLGTLGLIGTTTTLTGSNEYITHNSSGTSGSGGVKSWTFNWTAPAIDVADSVIFYGAFNVANGTGDQLGDSIYTSTTKVMRDTLATPVVPTSISVINKSSTISIYPNPVSDFITVSNLNGAEQMNVTITDMKGNVVKNVVHVNHGQTINVAELAPGVYSAIIETNSGASFKSIIKQ